MILGSDSQNKNLRDAASKRIDTTPRTRTSNKLAAKIATSGTSSSGGSVNETSSVAHTPRSKINDGVPDPVRGSFEGLDNAPSTRIQINNSGYANKKIQTARYKDRTPPKFENIGKMNFTGFTKYGSMTRYNSIAPTNSSANKLNSKLAVEKMFR